MEDSFSADRRWGEWFRDDSSTLHLLLYFQSNAISDLIGGTSPQSGCVKAHPFDSPLDVQLSTGLKLVRQAGHEWVFLGSAGRIHTRATAMKVMTLISLQHLSLFKKKKFKKGIPNMSGERSFQTGSQDCLNRTALFLLLCVFPCVCRKP